MRKTWILGIVFVLVTSLAVFVSEIKIKQFVLGTSTGLADSPWPMFHGGSQHGGLSKYDTGHVDGTILWETETGATLEGIERGMAPILDASPVIGPDGTIYLGANDNKLYAISPGDGKIKWVFNAGDPAYDARWKSYGGIFTTPAIGDDGTIYLTTDANFIIAVNPEGKEKWRIDFPMTRDFWSSPVIGSDGTIYVGSARSDESPVGTGGAAREIKTGLLAINPDGTIKWIFPHEHGSSSSPTIGPDGTIYASGYISINPDDSEDSYKRDSGDGLIFAITPDGKEKWQYRFELWLEAHQSVSNDGTIYTGSKEGKIYAINPDGSKKWEYDTKSSGMSSAPAIGPDGTVYVGTWDSIFYALTPSGKVKWKKETPEGYEAICGSAAVGAEGTVYFSNHANGIFYAMNPDGTEKWKNEVSGFFAGGCSSPVIGEGGVVYYARDTKLYAFGGGGEGKTAVSNVKNTTRLLGLPPLVLGGAAVILVGSILVFVLRKRR